MATSPEQVRTGLTVVTTAAAAELAEVATAAPVEQVRGVLFEVVPLIAETYSTAAAALGADWYEELRDAAAPGSPFVPTVVIPDRADALQATVAVATPELRDTESMQEILDPEAYLADVLAEIEAEMQREIANALRETVTENTERDPDAVGWRRHVRGSESCKFCQMLADKGAIFTENTARFAAHTHCRCLAGPVFGRVDGPTASVLQYAASRRNRSEKERAKLREYLNEHYPDAPG